MAEDLLKELPDAGYFRLGSLISRDKNLAIFRRFDDLNIVCLLELQAEILSLRKSLYLAIRVDQDEGDEEEKTYAINFQKSRKNNSTQYQLIAKLREKLVQYNKLLNSYSTSNNLPSPRTSQLDSLRWWLRHRDGGANFQLEPAEFDTWLDNSESNKNQFLSVRPPGPETDGFNNFLNDFISGSFHRWRGEKWDMGTVIDEKTQLRSYRDSRIARASSTVVTIIASIFPPLTILVLNSLSSTDARIGVTVAFTAIFAGILAYFSTARRVEVLVATATFAAVEVVFIGTAIESSGQKD